MKNNYKKIILSSLIIVSSCNIFSIYTDFRIYDLFPTLNANVDFQYDENQNLELLNEVSNTLLVIKYGTNIKLNKKKFKNYTFQKYSSQEKAIYVLDQKKNRKIYPIQDLKYISFRVESIKRNEIGMVIGGIVGGVVAFYPSAFAGFFVALGLSELFGADWWNSSDGNPLISATCLGITAVGTAYGAKMGIEIGGNLGNPYIHVQMNAPNGWIVNPK